MTTSNLRAASVRRRKRGGKGRTLEDTNGGGEVVDPSSGFESSDDDGGRGDEIVGEGVVQIALRRDNQQVTGALRVGRMYLKLKDILDRVEFLLEPNTKAQSAAAGAVPLLGVLSAQEAPRRLRLCAPSQNDKQEHETHLALNSSKVSSACSLRRGTEVVKFAGW